MRKQQSKLEREVSVMEGEPANSTAPNMWNTPDWSDPSAYADYSSFPTYLWRWEFVRRSARYRADWQKFDASQRLIQSAAIRIKEKRSRDKNVIAYERELAGSSFKDFQWGRDAQGVTGEERLALPYGLFEMVPPSVNATEVNVQLFVDAERYLTEISFKVAQDALLSGDTVVPRVRGEKPRGRTGTQANTLLSFAVRASARGRILASIDPHQPLDPQLRLIKKEIDKRSSPTRLHPEHFELMLRLIDARSGDSGSVPDWSVIQSSISKEKNRKHLDVSRLKRKHRDALKTQDAFIRVY